MIAQRIDLLALHEMVMARALPIVIPTRAACFVLDRTASVREGGGGDDVRPFETGPV